MGGNSLGHPSPAFPLFLPTATAMIPTTRTALLAAAAALLLTACGATNPDPNHTHADFSVVINGTEWDFSQEKYMSDHPEQTDGHMHAQFFHLHDGNGDVMHSHLLGQPIIKFFQSLGWDWDEKTRCMTADTGEQWCDADNKAWRMTVNDRERPFNMAYSFEDEDRILLWYGQRDALLLENMKAVTDKACIYSLTCPERGDAPTENCVANEEGICVDPKRVQPAADDADAATTEEHGAH